MSPRPEFDEIRAPPLAERSRADRTNGKIDLTTAEGDELARLREGKPDPAASEGHHDDLRARGLEQIGLSFQQQDHSKDRLQRQACSPYDPGCCPSILRDKRQEKPAREKQTSPS